MDNQIAEQAPFEIHTRCLTEVSFEDVLDGYYAQCPDCDEDLFSFEVMQIEEED